MACKYASPVLVEIDNPHHDEHGTIGYTVPEFTPPRAPSEQKAFGAFLEGWHHATQERVRAKVQRLAEWPWCAVTFQQVSLVFGANMDTGRILAGWHCKPCGEAEKRIRRLRGEEKLGTLEAKPGAKVRCYYAGSGRSYTRNYFDLWTRDIHAKKFTAMSRSELECFYAAAEAGWWDPTAEQKQNIKLALMEHEAREYNRAHAAKNNGPEDRMFPEIRGGKTVQHDRQIVQQAPRTAITPTGEYWCVYPSAATL